MAITYHAGRRIQKLDNDTIPTASTCDTFTSDNWTDVGGLFGVSGGKFAFEINTTARDDHASLDTGSLLSASTTWTLRFNKIRFTTITNNDPNLIIGLSDGTEGGGTAQKWIGARILPQGGSASGLFRPYSVNETAPNAGQDENNTLQYYANKDYYVEIKKTASNAYRARLSTTPDHSGDLVDSSQGGINSSITGRYIKVMNGENETGGTLIGTIDSIEFWTPAPSDSDHKTENQMPLSNQVGSRLEETNTRKMYNYAESGATDIQDKTLVQNGDDITYSGGVIDVNIGSSSSSEGDYLLHTLDVPITTADFVLDFDYKRVSGGTGVFGGLVFRSNQSGESIENSNTGDYIRTSPNANGTSMNMYWHNDGESSETELGYLTGLNSATNWNYLRLTRTNGTNIKLERFSNSARSGSANAEVAVTNLSATWGLSLKYIGGYCAYASGGGLEEHFDNIDLSSTTKLWQEIGT